jgi:membrane protein required for beta-lactamase induction
MSTEEAIRLVMLAFAAGLAVPLALQLFFTLRTTQRAITSTRVRMERTLDGLDGVLNRFQAPTNQTLSAVGAALVPAAVAAFKAWRESSSDTESSTAAGEKNTTTVKENGHART